MLVEQLIKQRIRDEGPMTIAEYMALALAHPEDGYYIRRDPFGVQGDFITAPETSQIFGELIGAWLVTQWIIMGKPEAALAEIGPGRGTLMADILRATANVRGFHDSISVHLMEISTTLRQKQWNALAGRHPDIRWHTGFAEIPPKPLLLVANEFFDALPIRQYMHTDLGWKERRVALSCDDALEFIFVDETPPEILEHAPVSDRIYEHCDAGGKLMEVISNRINSYGGCALVIDYGYEGSPNINKGGNTLQSVRSHAFHDVLVEPGTADITAHVDFYTLSHAAAEGGCVIYGPAYQGEWLMRLGARERTEILCKDATESQKKLLLTGLARLTAADQMGELFKVMCVAHPSMPMPEGF
jgi:NADH dehydrogenase [ubiquinone] 1 alpha subcomplex assembly factor 7